MQQMVDLIIHSVFGKIAILLTPAAAIGFAGLMPRQPMIVSFIAVGLLAGPSGFDVVRSDEQIDFLAGLTVAQISEFSLIFVAMGVTLGHLGRDMLGLVTLVGLVTIALSTYMITYSHRLFEWLEPVLALLERSHTPAPE